jgi:hypothetical protein
MRRAFRLVFIFFLTLGCGGGGEFEGFENPSSPSPVALANGSMSALIDGRSWNADDYVEVRFPFPANPMFMNVSGGDRHAWNVTFSVNSAVIGTQTFAAARGQCSSSSQSGNFVGTSGQVTFTTLTANRVAGTFSCDVLDRNDSGGGARTRSVTNGAFDIRF